MSNRTIRALLPPASHSAGRSTASHLLSRQVVALGGGTARTNSAVVYLLALPMLLFLLAVPATILFGLFDLAGEEINRGGELLRALGVSLRGAAGAVLLVVLFGSPLALATARARRRGLKSALLATMTLPMVLPPAATGLGLLILLGPRGYVSPLLDSLGISIAFSPAAVIVAQLFVSAPLYLLQATRAFEITEARYRELALVDGVRGADYIRLVLLPISRRPLELAALSAGARALGEFGATMMFAGSLPGLTQTLPMTVYLGLQRGVATALGAASLLLGFGAIGLLVTQVLLRWEPET